MHQFVSKLLTFQKERMERMLDNSPRKICVLKSFQWKSCFPRYISDMHRCLYLLKYSYSYIYDYYAVYKFLIQAMEADLISENHILSIGCGSMLDKVGLKYAQDETPKIKFCYHGVDRYDWDSECAEISNYGRFIKSVLGNLKRNRFSNEIGVLFFARSLSEISISELKKFIKRFHKNNFRNRLYIASVPVSDKKINSDRDKLDYLGKQILKSKKFISIKYIHNTLFSQYTDKMSFYSNHNPKYNYDPDVLQWLQNMNSFCPPDCQDRNADCKFIWKRPNMGFSMNDPMILVLER